MTVSNRLGITELAASQVDRSVTINEAIALLEAGATFYAAVQVLLNTPPGSPAEGDLYIVGTAGTGAWSGKNNNVTVYYNAAWLFMAPIEGMFAWDQTANLLKRYDGSSWVTFAATGATVADADYGDITVSSSGAAWTIDNDVVTNAKSANMAQSTIKGRAAAAGTGDPTDLSVAQVIAMIGDTDGTLAANSDLVFATQKATKTYVDGLALNLGKRGRVRAATTADITVATALNNGDTLDGVTLATGDLVLVKNQSAPAGNGIYVVGASPARSSEFDTYDEHPGSLIAVEEGTAGADTLWLCTSNAGGTLNTTAIAFSQFVVPSMASTTDVLTGTDTAKAVTSDAVAALWEKGADVASSGTTSLGEGGYFHVTGTTTITDIDWATAKDGRVAWVIFDGILTLTHNATTLKLPGGANITTAAGDRACFVEDASDNVICLAYIRADGTPLLSTTLQSNVSANLTKGYTATGYSAGTKSSGTFTPDPANGNLQYYTNGGAHTLAPPSTGGGDACQITMQVTNNGSAGAITTSGFTKVTGSALTTVNGDDFMFYITVLNGFSVLNVVALQ